jgi:DNA-binding CsgD family transcriptional regulator
VWDDVSDAVLVFNDALKITWSNRSGCEMLRTQGVWPEGGPGGERPASGPVALAEIVPPTVAAERRSMMQSLAEPGSCIRVVGMLFGRWMRVVYRALPSPPRAIPNGVGPQGGTWLGVHTPLSECAGHAPHPTPAGQHTAAVAGEARAQADDLGDLSDLTERELQVLRLIGLGMSTQEMSDALGRSVKTVEGHRLSLGEKLGQHSKVGLARLSIAAGLTLLPTEEIARIAHRAARRRS